ncbi:hypothetical protein L873DRAFT_1789863 [Choiromyces venosus 120613-1]|uniref:Uncharacterized protein n=1 Tax=Choiromyces venosus 120613-1 TaxID=1336337 RepID=A0A3N4JPB9_9PEZI|nr:hypothetical protein L873DRAFT_1789863 [Choiromyces venosus 120613-1]
MIQSKLAVLPLLFSEFHVVWAQSQSPAPFSVKLTPCQIVSKAQQKKRGDFRRNRSRHPNPPRNKARHGHAQSIAMDVPNTVIKLHHHRPLNPLCSRQPRLRLHQEPEHEIGRTILTGTDRGVFPNSTKSDLDVLGGPPPRLIVDRRRSAAAISQTRNIISLGPNSSLLNRLADERMIPLKAFGIRNDFGASHTEPSTGRNYTGTIVGAGDGSGGPGLKVEATGLEYNGGSILDKSFTASIGLWESDDPEILDWLMWNAQDQLQPHRRPRFRIQIHGARGRPAHPDLRREYACQSHRHTPERYFCRQFAGGGERACAF